jgi:hypothetical protein
MGECSLNWNAPSPRASNFANRCLRCSSGVSRKSSPCNSIKSNAIDHTRTKTKSPQTNGICERFHRTVLDEFYRMAFRKKIYPTIDELQSDLDVWVKEYNETRPLQGRWCYGKRRCRPFLTRCPLRGRNCCRSRNAGHKSSSDTHHDEEPRQVKCILLQINSKHGDSA